MFKKNPLSIPGSWGQESEAHKEDEQEKCNESASRDLRQPQLTQETQAESADAVPRGAVAGVVNKSGEIVDDSGKTVGKISDSKNPQDLVGNTVTAAGDIVSDSGDVLAKASLDSEYTTRPAEGGAKSGSWNLLGKTKSAFRTAENIRKPVGNTLEFAGKLQNLGQRQGGDTDAKQAEGDLGSAKGEKHSTDAGTSRQDTSANVSERTSVKDPAETPSSSAHGDHSPSIHLKDNDTTTGANASDTLHKTPAADAAQDESQSKSATGVEDAKSDVTAPGEDKTADDSMDMKSPVPMDEKDAQGAKDVKPETNAVDAKQASDQTGRESPEQATEKASGQINDRTSNESTDTATERGRSVGEADKATDQRSPHQATERASSGQPSEQTTEKAAEQASSGQAPAGQGQELKEDKTTQHAPSKKGLGREADKATEHAPQGVKQTSDTAPTEDLGEASDRVREQATSEHPAEHAGHDRGQTQSPTSADVDTGAVTDAKTKAGLEAEVGDETKAGTGDAGGDAAALKETHKDGAQGDDAAEVGRENAGNELQQEKDATETAGKDETEVKTQPMEYGVLKGAKVNETGDLVDSDDNIIGRLIEGDAKELQGKTADESGNLSNESGEVIGRAEPLSADRSILKGTEVNKTGDLVDSDDNAVGRLVEGDAKKLLGKTADESGNLVDESGEVIGRAEPLPKNERQEAEEGEEKPGEYGNLKGAKVNKAGNVVDSDGDTVGRLVEGDAKQLFGKKADESGNFLDESGKVVGRAEPLPEDEPEIAKEEESQSADSNTLKGAKVNKAGNVVDSDGDVVGRLVEGDVKELLGKVADESGNFRDESGKIVGRAEPIPDEEPEAAEEEQQQPIDYSILKGTKVNKAGNLVDRSGDVVGRLVEGDVKQLLGRTADESGNLWNDSGKIVGRAEPIPDDERAGAKDFAPFENFPDATVEADGRVMSGGRQVGTVVDGDHKRLKGSRVDEDGDILDRRGNVIGKAEAWDEPEPEVEAEKDRSMLAGKRVNKAGNVVDSAGVIYGRVIEGNVASLVGRMCNKDGNVMSESGDVIGKAELVPEHEREGSRDGPFAELVGCTVTKDGKVVTGSGDVVGRLTSGEGKKLFGRSVDEDGDVVDRNGNVLGKAERWEEPEVEKRRDPLAGRRVNREGNVVDEDGNLLGKLVSGDLAVCSGKEVDDDGDVINSKGTTIGHVSRLEDIPQEPEPEPEVETETAEEKEVREQAEKDRKLAGQLSQSIEQSLDKMRPICKMITDKIDSAERKPKEELDEEQLVKEVKPLIEEGHRVLTETNGVIRGLDPDGRIQRNAKHKAATRDASTEEHHLAEVLKEVRGCLKAPSASDAMLTSPTQLTGTVSQTIENAQRKIEGMPHAKKELNPLWGLLTEPLFQILAAVGLLLNGVLGLVGQLLSGLGLGGIVDKLLGGLGLNKILGSLGLGGALDALTGKKKK